jgi:hypothetical protein
MSAALLRMVNFGQKPVPRKKAKQVSTWDNKEARFK